MKYIILTLAFAATQALATRAPEHCEPKAPEVKTPTAKAPEPRQSQREPGGKPCERTDAPFWCPRVK